MRSYEFLKTSHFDGPLVAKLSFCVDTHKKCI